MRRKGKKERISNRKKKSLPGSGDSFLVEIFR